ncbi:RNA polymerase II-associated protein 1 isoform X3 [Rhinoraja longicauda]
MLGRPKPGESEDDLLLFQKKFLATGISPAAKVIKKADKRKVELKSAGGSQAGEDLRDVVTLEGLPSLPPPLMLVPPKKSKVEAERVRFQEDDGEEQMDLQDTHITAVLSKIIERDTSASPINPPISTGLAFPKVFHRSEIQSEPLTPISGKKSIFAQKLEAQRAAEAAESCQVASSERGISPLIMCTGTQRSAQSQPAETSEKKHSPGTDVGKPTSGGKLGLESDPQEAQRIHEENLASLQAMSKEEIEEECNNLVARLDPSLIAFLKSRRSGKSCTEASSNKTKAQEAENNDEDKQRDSRLEAEQQSNSPNDDPMDQESTEPDIPLKPEKGWVHMDVLEYEKLEWMKDLPKPRRRKTNKQMQARFNFQGDLIPPGDDVPTHLGLHHHGEQPEEAGYSLQDLFHLSRSQIIQQRTLALQTLAHVIQKAKAGDFSSSLKHSVVRMLLDAGFLFLLRYSLDDHVENVIAACVQSLKALLVSTSDEECLDRTFSWYLGSSVFPLRPNEIEEEEDDDDDDEEEPKIKQSEKAKEDKKADPDVARIDAIKGLLKMKVLHRLRYILEVVRPAPSVVLDILEILIRIARHSSEACNQILVCPRLVETIVSEFLPSTWKIQTLSRGDPMTSSYGVPLAAAMKLIRVLACTGRNMSAILLNKFNMKERIGRLIAQDPGDLPLELQEAHALSIEAMRLWAVAANYGQACDMYKDFYPVLMKILQTLPNLVSQPKKEDPSFDYSLQRAETLVCLLINVTHTAGCAFELQAQFTSSAKDQEEHIPPPPLDWSHVAGIKPFLEGCVKRCFKEISCPTWNTVRQLTTTYIIYLATYYSKLIQQPSYRPIECLEELEQFCLEFLFPLLNQPTLEKMFEDLRSFSALCNPKSCCLGPETPRSLVSLGFVGEVPPLSLTGSKSPFAFLTALVYLLDTICIMHKGLAEKCSTILHSKGLKDYLVHSCKRRPPINHKSAWLLRHEFHFQHFVLKLASKTVALNPQVAQQAPLYHHVVLALLSLLLPGSEFLARDLLSGVAFNQALIPEGKFGGPEAEDLLYILQLGATRDTAEKACANPTRGTLLGAAFNQLPTIRARYLAHFAHLQTSVLRSRNFYTGQNHLTQSVQLPEMTGPLLPADWAFLPLINLYDQVSREEMKGRTVDSLPENLVEMVSSSLQWVLLLETWRGGLLQGLPLAAKFARLSCVFLTGNNLFLEPAIRDNLSALLSIYCQRKRMDSLDLSTPLPGLVSFHDLYISLLEQFESVSFGDQLFGSFLLLPLQRRFDAQLRRAVFGEHVSVLRALGVPLKQKFDAARRSMLRKSYLLADKVLRRHLLHFKLPNVESSIGFDMYEEMPPVRRRWLQKELGDLLKLEKK